MRSLSIVADLRVAVNNEKTLTVAMETQELVPLALLSTYRIFHTAMRNKNVPTSACKVLNVFVLFGPNFEFL